jgi:hypothetical protein
MTVVLCRNCGRLIERCVHPTCGLGWVHLHVGDRLSSHYCDDPPRHGATPPRFAEPDPAT